MCVDEQAAHVHDDCFLSPSFKLVLICTSRDLKTSFACVYESASGVWGNIVSTSTTNMVRRLRPSILIGNTVYWLFHGREILALRTTLHVIEMSAEIQYVNNCSFQLLRTDDDGVLGLAVKSKLGIHIWERKLISDGVTGWVLLQKINQLEGISCDAFRNANMVGYDEELNVVVLFTHSGDFMVHLKSMQIRLISKTHKWAPTFYFPYRNFNTAGRGVGWKWVDPNL
ncbi:hypothetical protein ZWY2020_056964 [Hordeum vulgare]|nr:hypothetical protein ZWY2020_056964 [Hordeum vulgare]